MQTKIPCVMMRGGTSKGPYLVASDLPDGPRKRISVEHPSGEFSVELEVGGTVDAPEIKRAALLRTTRRLMEGNVLIPARAWDGKSGRMAEAAE